MTTFSQLSGQLSHKPHTWSTEFLEIVYHLTRGTEETAESRTIPGSLPGLPGAMGPTVPYSDGVSATNSMRFGRR